MRTASLIIARNAGPLALSALVMIAGCQLPQRTPNSPEVADLPVVNVSEQFQLDEPGDDWALAVPGLWRIGREGDRRFLQMAARQRPGSSSVLDPREYAIYGPYQFRGFSLSTRIRVDSDPDTAARNAVVIFGWQDSNHFYYVSLAGQTDEWHNTIVRVDGQTRVSLAPAAGRPGPTMTDVGWHKVDVLRNANTGAIEVYLDAYDEPARPVLRVTDRTYEWGHIGLGSAGDRASFACLKLEGQARSVPRPRLTTRPVP